MIGIGRPGTVRQFADLLVPSDVNVPPNSEDNEGSEVAIQEFSFYPYARSAAYLNGRAVAGQYSVALDGSRESLVNTSDINSSRFASYFSKAGSPSQTHQSQWDPDVWTLLYNPVANGYQIGSASGDTGIFAYVAPIPVVCTGDVFRLGNQKYYGNTYTSQPLTESVNGYAVGDIARVVAYNAANSLGYNRLGARQPGCVWIPGGSDMFTDEVMTLDGAITWSLAISLFQTMHATLSTDVSWVASGPQNATQVGQTGTMSFLTLEQVHTVMSADQNDTLYGLSDTTHIFTYWKLIARKTSL